MDHAEVKTAHLDDSAGGGVSRSGMGTRWEKVSGTGWRASGHAPGGFVAALVRPGRRVRIQSCSVIDMDIPVGDAGLTVSRRVQLVDDRTRLRHDTHQTLGRTMRTRAPYPKLATLVVVSRMFSVNGGEPPATVRVLEWVDTPDTSDFPYLRRVGSGWLWSYSATEQIPDVPATPNDWAGAVGACVGLLREVPVETDAAVGGGQA